MARISRNASTCSRDVEGSLVGGILRVLFEDEKVRARAATAEGQAAGRSTKRVSLRLSPKVRKGCPHFRSPPDRILCHPTRARGMDDLGRRPADLPTASDGLAPDWNCCAGILS